MYSITEYRYWIEKNRRRLREKTVKQKRRKKYIIRHINDFSICTLAELPFRAARIG